MNENSIPRCLRNWAIFGLILVTGSTMLPGAEKIFLKDMAGEPGWPPVGVWQKKEIVFEAEKSYENPYKQVEVWVDLKGPGFEKRCYGFWDGGKTFKVRIMATAAGNWSWRSGSNQRDSGLNGKTGTFSARDLSESEKEANPNLRGMIKASANGHAFEYADGTPFFLLGDTWWSAGTFRYPWYDDDRQRAIAHGAGFKDYVRLRKKVDIEHLRDCRKTST